MAIDWNTFAPGTSAKNQNHNSYSARTNLGTLYIDPPTMKNRAWVVSFSNELGALSGGLWHSVGSANSAASAKKLAREWHAQQVRANPLTRTTVAADSQRPRASKTAKGRPTKTKAPSRRLMGRRRATEAAPEGFYGNPLSRVKINSPSMATGAPPSERLKKRRRKTAREPMPGIYANPAPSFAFDAVHADRGTYAAQMKKSGKWQTVAVFRDFKEAKSWGQTVSDSHNKQVRIVGNLKVK